MLPNDNAGHLDHILTVYSSMEHVTWKRCHCRLCRPRF